MLFDRDFYPVEVVNEFMLDHCFQPAKASRWRNTQTAYADDLAYWIAFLDRRGLSLEMADRQTVKSYVAELQTEALSRRTKRQLAATTVRRRVITVLKFYEWAIAEDKFQGFDDWSEFTARRSVHRAFGPIDDIQAIYNRSGFTKERDQLLPASPDPSDLARPFSAPALRAVLSALGPEPGAGGRLRRDRLIAETSLYSGMRIDEVCGLTRWQIEDAERQLGNGGRYEPARIEIKRTKGRDSRYVFLPAFHIANLIEYIDFERKEVISIARDRGKFRAPSDRIPSALFLNGKYSNLRDIGQPITTDTVSRRFHAAAMAVGLFNKFDCFPDQAEANAGGTQDADGSEPPSVKVVRHVFHDLRHTYAVNYYLAAERHGRHEPWKKLQALLGHKHLKTTQDVYQPHVASMEAIISDLQLLWFRSVSHEAA